MDNFWKKVLNGEIRKEMKGVKASRKFLEDTVGKEIPELTNQWIEESVEMESKSSHPRELNPEVKTIGEEAYQRGFIGNRITPLFCSGKKVAQIKWLDIELPIIPGKKYGVDMIGNIQYKGMNQQKIIFIELKKYNENDSPIYAFFECLFYALNAFGNREVLVNKKIFHPPDGKYIKNEFNFWHEMKYIPDMIITAVEEYWTYWKKKYNNNLAGLFDLVETIKNKLPNQPEVTLVKFPKTDFEEQYRLKTGKKYNYRNRNKISYRPEICEKDNKFIEIKA